MRYHRLGELPPKRHVQFREDDVLLTEEVMGYEGFSGNEARAWWVSGDEFPSP